MCIIPACSRDPRRAGIDLRIECEARQPGGLGGAGEEAPSLCRAEGGREATDHLDRSVTVFSKDY